jgi:hypothetical protein
MACEDKFSVTERREIGNRRMRGRDVRVTASGASWLLVGTTKKVGRAKEARKARGRLEKKAAKRACGTVSLDGIPSGEESLLDEAKKKQILYSADFVRNDLSVVLSVS